jgi:hypothetical protein
VHGLSLWGPHCRLQELCDKIRGCLETVEESLDPEDRAMIVPYSSTPIPGNAPSGSPSPAVPQPQPQSATQQPSHLQQPSYRRSHLRSNISAIPARIEEGNEAMDASTTGTAT